MDTVSTIWGSITGSKPVETEQTLEAERRKCNEDIDARLKTLRDAPATASPVDAPPAPVDAPAASPVAATMGGGRRRTRRSKRSKKTKRRRGKRSGKRTRR